MSTERVATVVMVVFENVADDGSAGRFDTSVDYNERLFKGSCLVLELV